MAGRYQTKQLGKVLDRFKDECGPDLWDEVSFAYLILIEKGPHATAAAKKLKGADGIWELKANLGNLQPRLLFYQQPSGQIVFVHAFIKKGAKDYANAIDVAQQRRRSIEKGEKELNEFPTSSPHIH